MRDKAAFRLGERDLSPRLATLLQLARSAIGALAAPAIVAISASTVSFWGSDLWLPTGYPIVLTTLTVMSIIAIRSARHRALFRRLYQTAGRHLPPARLSILARGGFVDVSDGREREVSILLADLVGFTEFSNDPGRNASEVVEAANHYFTLMQAVIDRCGGCSDKFLGDAVLAFWNGLADEPDHALRAVVAANNILQEISLTKALEEHCLTVRVVVCSGRVYVGDLGTKQRRNFTIVGPAVNETFRLEKLPDAYGIALLIAGSTVKAINALQQSIGPAAHLPQGTALVKIDEVELKGFAEPRTIYALIDAGDPGLAAFVAAREAIDANHPSEGYRRLLSIDRGMLQPVARVLASICRLTAAGWAVPAHFTRFCGK
jgi:adenylate cyclase